MSKDLHFMQDVLKDAGPEQPPLQDPARFTFPGGHQESYRFREPKDFDPRAQQECLRLVQRIFFGQSSTLRRAVVFAGIDRGNGCSRICAETARILATNTSARICLVDANLRSPSLSRLFGVSEAGGLVEALRGGDEIRNLAKQLTPSNQWLIPAGHLAAEWPGLLNSETLKLRLQELRNEFDYLLIDAPGLNLYPDAIALGRVVDGVVLILEADSTRRESALKALTMLRDAQVEVLGAVLNQRKFPIPDFVYRRL